MTRSFSRQPMAPVSFAFPRKEARPSNSHNPISPRLVTPTSGQTICPATVKSCLPCREHAAELQS